MTCYFASAALRSDEPESVASQAVSSSAEEQGTASHSWYELVLAKVEGLFSSGSQVPSNLMTKSVFRGRFRITVNERGFLDSQHNETLTCKVPGSTTIIKIVSEGVFVNKGDVICELDSSSFEDNARQQEINVTQADAAFLNARENLAIQETQNESNIAIAQLLVDFAELDFDKYVQGDLPQQRDKILGQIQLKEEQLTRKKESYEFTKRMTKKGYRSQSDLEAERLSVTKAEIDLRVEIDNRRVLDDFTSVRKLAQLRADKTEYTRDFERIKRKASAALAKATADFESRELTLEVQNEKYDEWLERIENCTMIAPQDGEIVYAKSSSSRRSSSEPEIQAGATVRERQPIINIPDVTAMKIDAKIHESMISQIQIGQPVTARADAQPGKVFNGIVAEISSVPLSGSFPNYDIKEYQVAINLTDAPEHVSLLRPGLSADFEIIVQDRMDVLQIPMQSVVQIGEEYYCWALIGTKLERRLLKIGDSNDTDIEVLDGVSEGELVVMNPRSNFSEQIALLEELRSSNLDTTPIRKPIAPSVIEKQRETTSSLKPSSPGKGPRPGAGSRPGKGSPPRGGKGKPAQQGSRRR